MYDGNRLQFHSIVFFCCWRKLFYRYCFAHEILWLAVIAPTCRYFLCSSLYCTVSRWSLRTLRILYFPDTTARHWKFRLLHISGSHSSTNKNNYKIIQKKINQNFPNITKKTIDLENMEYLCWVFATWTTRAGNIICHGFEKKHSTKVNRIRSMIISFLETTLRVADSDLRQPLSQDSKLIKMIFVSSGQIIIISYN